MFQVSKWEQVVTKIHLVWRVTQAQINHSALESDRNSSTGTGERKGAGAEWVPGVGLHNLSPASHVACAHFSVLRVLCRVSAHNSATLLLLSSSRVFFAFFLAFINDAKDGKRKTAGKQAQQEARSSRQERGQPRDEGTSVSASPLGFWDAFMTRGFQIGAWGSIFFSHTVS